MSKSTNINVRVKPEIKSQAEKMFNNYGITLSEAVNIFLHKSIMVGGIPFDMLPSTNSEADIKLDLKDIFVPMVDTKKNKFVRSEHSGRY